MPSKIVMLKNGANIIPYKERGVILNEVLAVNLVTFGK